MRSDRREKRTQYAPRGVANTTKNRNADMVSFFLGFQRRCVKVAKSRTTNNRIILNDVTNMLCYPNIFWLDYTTKRKRVSAHSSEGQTRDLPNTK